MCISPTIGHRLRSQRLSRNGGRLLIVPLDHSVTDGPIVADGSIGTLVDALAAGGADAVVLHKGTVRMVDYRAFADLSLIVHLSASTAQAPDPDAKYLVANVEEALRLGAEGVSVHVNVGSADERRQIADLAAVAEACDRWGMPLLAMMYARGPRVDPHDPNRLAHAAVLAADLGADLVKVPYPGSVAAMADITHGCPVPVLAAGGAPAPDQHTLLSYVDDVLLAGTGGLAMGRNLFQAADVAGLTRAVAARVHASESAPRQPVLSR
ncbi:MAG: 2-amino-4,5-dihydroxy-6-one-heptanoic acid-7-phosphate synthase [Micromonosporaceae bacterium]|nr:2-amino-4,5-dihydroxy-6-one-heptanoic acid-7-phosphate synthase [Micromonosporaceae bacterium]